LTEVRREAHVHRGNRVSYLVIQGLEVETPDLKELAKLSGASRIEGLGNNAFRLHEYKTEEGVAAYCAGAKLDFAFVPQLRKLSDFGLVAMDMDSTLITIECIDEIADLRGIKPEVAAITASAMRGEIEYHESLRRRLALLAGLDESALLCVYEERLRLSPGAERMLERLGSLGIKTLLVSSGFSFFTERLKHRLSIDYTLSNTLEFKDGKLTGKVLGRIVDAQIKAAKLRELRDGLRLTRDQVIAIGDGANDLAMMAEAGVSIAYHAKPVVREKATYCFDYVGLDGVLNLYG
jgi:phosphoserine phosphatase